MALNYKSADCINTTTVELARELVSFPSFSPDTSPAQACIANRLSALGFRIRQEVLSGCNTLYARYGTSGPLFLFSGHTDVVPPGEEKMWSAAPFAAEIRNNEVIGRGIADMKGNIAAMVTAVERYLSGSNNDPNNSSYSIGFLITGDEEIGGSSARASVERLIASGEAPSCCLVGEPSSEQTLGDTIKIGRRGILRGTIHFLGRQGHVGYPNLAENALHMAFAPLLELSRHTWDEESEFFAPTSLQFTEAESGIAHNVIPGEATFNFNFRFAAHTVPDELKRQFVEILNNHPDCRYRLDWNLSSVPFLTKNSVLTDIVCAAIQECLGIKARHSTAGGASDARYFATHGIPVVEFGVRNRTIHQIDERTSIDELNQLSAVYEAVLRRFEISVQSGDVVYSA